MVGLLISCTKLKALEIICPPIFVFILFFVFTYHCTFLYTYNENKALDKYELLSHSYVMLITHSNKRVKLSSEQRGWWHIHIHVDLWNTKHMWNIGVYKHQTHWSVICSNFQQLLLMIYLWFNYFWIITNLTCAIGSN